MRFNTCAIAETAGSAKQQNDETNHVGDNSCFGRLCMHQHALNGISTRADELSHLKQDLLLRLLSVIRKFRNGHRNEEQGGQG